MRLAAALALLASLAPRARAAAETAIAREEWRALGWNGACSVALEIKEFTKLGAGIQEDPIETRIGTLSIPPQKEEAALQWNLELDGAFSWDGRAAAGAEGDLRDAGYVRPGFPETVADAAGTPSGPAEVLLSTAALSARLTTGWPPSARWRLSAAEFNPLSTCALLVYEQRSKSGPRRRFLLVRVYAPRARLERALAHDRNARRLYEAGSVDAALAEAATGARLAPDLAETRYQNAALLTLAGHINEAVDELSAAIKLDPALRAKARDDEDLESLRVRDDFLDLTREPTSAPQ